ncbi:MULTISPECIES: OFA family MFS transporter [Bacillaceae]|uniref:OFA family MFS transporter n=1 Tax=Evansella alkalicola TaxID=745819 RepID=A0ABS6JYF5_9BACI|nr:MULTISPECIES: OFA family MFS transporter [Bacillaceae]MBU9723613.1 OFA family MFS transporter [Bacillus alkalicola]
MNRWFVVLGAVIIQINLGAVYAWSLFNQPLMEAFGWLREEVVITFSITIAVFAFITIFAGRLQDRIGPRLVATLGGVFLGIGLMLASQATTIIELYLYYGVVGGIGIGMAYVCPLSACVKWFPDKRGLISGIAVAGFGLGGLIFQPIITRLIEGVGVSSSFFWVGLIYLLFVVAGAQLLKNPPVTEENQLEENGDFIKPKQYSTREMLASYQFYLLWIMFLFGSMTGLLVISYAVDIGVEIAKLDMTKAANAVTVIALFNAGGRIVLGKVSDRIGRMNTLMVIYGLTGLVMLYMAFGSINYLLFITIVSIIGFCFGGFLALFPSVTADFYGTRNIGGNYSLLYQAYGISAFVGPFIINFISFTQAFIISSLLCFIAMILAKLISTPIAKKEETVYIVPKEQSA